MDTGGKFLVSAAVLAVGGCGGESAKLEIPATPTPLAPRVQPLSFPETEARGR